MVGPNFYAQTSHIMSHTPSSTQQQSKHHDSTVADLQMRLDRQHLIIQTLLMILLEKKVIHDDEFREWMLYVDELDGVRDGKLREDKSPVVCPQCGRKSSATASRCAYCGHEFPPEFLAHRPKE